MQETNKVYNEIRDILFSKMNNPTFTYDKEILYTPFGKEFPGMSENFFTEKGSAQFENIYGNIIGIEIYRWHIKKNDGFYKFNPCLKANIYMMKKSKKINLFKLLVISGHTISIPLMSWFKIPKKLLEEKEGETITQNKTLLNKAIDLNKKYYLLSQIQEERKNQRYNSPNIKLYENEIEKIKTALDKTKKEAAYFNKLLEKYSTFNVEIIGNAIQQLMNVVENDEYVYLEINPNSKKFKKFWMFDKNEIINVILQKNKTNDFYRWYEDSVILSTTNKKDYDRNITFYWAVYNDIMCNTKFKKFNYVKDFVDNLIEYRFNNNLIEFTQKDMLIFLKDYITKNKDSIIENHYQNPKQKILNKKTT